MNKFTDPNVFISTFPDHLMANRSKFQISPQYGLSAFHMPIIIISDSGESYYGGATKTRGI